MSDIVQVVITLRKSVPDVATGRALTQLVKDRFADKPGVLVTGHCTTHYDMEVIPP